ncbi:MAG TPA: MarR family transcriptional regulator [Acidimicrobiia bacterium]|nr:MarR family transcriptional regulator [Acidimicrobiia bacterium]
MGTDTTQGSLPALSEEAWALLHELRLRGFRPARGGPVEDELVAAGLVMMRGVNVALAPAGREAHAAWARLAPGSEEEALAREAYERFLALNVEFLRLCTDWQLKPGNEPNDHSDAAYDFKILERLDRLDARAGQLLEGLGKTVPRMSGYRARLTEALDRISEDRQWLASPRCDSYHTVWMQLHEDLLTAVGVNRADEQQPE